MIQVGPTVTFGRTPREIESIFAPAGLRVRFDHSLANRTTIRAGGEAAIFLEPHTVSSLSGALELCHREDLPVRILGAGSNLIIGAGRIPAVVLSTRRLVEVGRNQNEFEVGAGAPLVAIIRRSLQCGLSGIESLAGIPASIGGALAMNAGGKYAEFGQFVKEAKLVHEDGQIEIVNDLGFAYRRCELRNRVVASVRIGLESSRPGRLRKRYREILEEKRSSQPLDQPTAGCVFKNPESHAAGALIEACDLKGVRSGGARISPKHANFIVNSGRATASDVTALMRRVVQTVSEQFGTMLHPEVVLW